MTSAAAEVELFGDVLTCEEHQRSVFHPQPVSAANAEMLCARAEASLLAVAVIEDNSGDDEDTSKFPALRRIEARLDLLMHLLATRQEDADTPLITLRWSARGACMPAPAALPVASTGLFHTRLAPWLPEPLALPARVLACDSQDPATPTRLWLRFEPISEPLLSALERHLFRRHRKAIAEQRARSA